MRGDLTDARFAQRQAMLRNPPHILVTTPESLYLLLTSGKSRERLRGVKTVIVDEIHALARDKRGSHLALSMERLAALADAVVILESNSGVSSPASEYARAFLGLPTDRIAFQQAMPTPFQGLLESRWDESCQPFGA